jgi:hypothetical protein
MQLPKIFQGESPKRLLQGAFAGGIATLVIGFTWGGWVTGGTAAKMTSEAVEATQVALYSPVCVERYMAKATPEQRAAFAKESNWRRDALIEKTGFATPPGSDALSDVVADRCAEMLTKQLEAAAANVDKQVKTN